MKALVVYYSRSGHTRKAAEAIRDALAAAGHEVQVEELMERKSRAGVMGWLTGGRDATRRRKSEIEPVQADVPAHDLVIIGTPVWAFTMTPAVRTFCAQHGSDARAVAFFCTMGGSGDARAFREMEEECGRAPLATLALIDRQVQAETEAFRAGVGKFVSQMQAAGTGGGSAENAQ